MEGDYSTRCWRALFSFIADLPEQSLRSTRRLMEPLLPSGLVFAYALGAAQGLFLAAVLASRRHNAVPNRLLAVAMLAFSVDLGMAVYHATGAVVAFPHLIGIDAGLAFLYGPLLYLYARTVSEQEHRFRRRYWAHFAPFGLLVLFLLQFYALDGAEKLAILHHPGEDVWTRGLAIVTPVKLVHALVYVGLVIVVLRRHRARLAAQRSSVEHATLNWLRNLVIGIVVAAGVSITFYALSARGSASFLGFDPVETYDDYTLLSLAAFVYAIGYLGLRQPEIFGEHRRVGGDGAREPEVPKERPRYARSGMDAETAQRHLAALLELMEAEKPYRRGDLALQDLADALSISAHNLTEVLSTQLGQTFYDFVNGYRVREVQERLRDPASAHLTVLAIGLDAGFNAKSSFYTAFKKHTGMTPSEYRRRAEAAA